jgi:nucleoside-diphosphate-sugar epimerase
VRAFVTGGTGFVGGHLVHALQARGNDVTVLVRSPSKAATLGWDRSVRLVRGDLAAADVLAEGVAGAEVVFHVAGSVRGHTPADFFRANRDGTARVLEALAGASPRRLVLVSSLAVAGPSAPGRPHESGDEANPVTDYGRSKRAAEDLVRGADVPWTIVRPAAVYGERDPEFLRLFKTVRFGLAPVFGEGTQELSFIHAADLADALITAAVGDAAVGRTYYAAHPETLTSRAVALAAGRAMGSVPRVVPLPAPVARGLLGAIGTAARLAGQATLLNADKANEFLAPAWTCSPAALSRDTGWEATTDLETGFRRTVAWYRERGWL